jgi:hypothetical protein
VIDALSQQPVEFDATAFRDREALGRADWIQAVCWIGARLAEALAHAHAQGVLHCDIKAGNILVTKYGRPLLTDFNVARGTHQEGLRVGGTVATMAPEHIDAFNPEYSTKSVDERSDVYSLGVVLFQLLAGRGPFKGVGSSWSPRPEALRALAADRRAGTPSVRAVASEVPEIVDRVVARCLEPEPEWRYPSAAELARTLDGCRELRTIEHALPPADGLTRAALRRPFLALILLTLAPHLIGSVINVAYNSIEIVNTLTQRQRTIFLGLVAGYNVIVYPLCLGLAWWWIAPSYGDWKAMRLARRISAEEVAEARRRVLAWPMLAVVLSCVGWLPGGLIFPAALSFFSEPGEPLSMGVYGHFLVSFWLSGLIALTYTFFAAEFVAVRVLYPRLWVDPQAVRSTAQRELASVAGRLRCFQLLAGLIPLASSALMIGLGLEDMSRTFRILATGLIVLGMAGIGLTFTVARTLSETLAALTGLERGMRDL